LKAAIWAHIQDVENGCALLADELTARAKAHYHTKIDFYDEHYQDNLTAEQGVLFKQLGWWQKHLAERHHLYDRVPEDVDLIDVLEMIVDNCMAGAARGGAIRDMEIPEEVLRRAVENTVQFLRERTVINEKQSHIDQI